MARTIFLILVSLNVAMLAWVYLNAERHEMAGREPQRTALQLQPEKIRIIEPTVRADVVCQAFAGVALADAQELAREWGPQFPSVTFSVVPAPSASTFDAVIGSFNTRAAVTARLAELHTLGVAEGFALRADEGGKFSLAASFADRPGAEAKQRAAAQKGVADVNVVERSAPAATAVIQARGVAAALVPVAVQATTRNLAVATCP